MGQRATDWVLQIAISTALGLVLGITIGWVLWPVAYTDTSPDMLREDYRDDYVLMIATGYQVDEDLAEARSRLEVVNADTPAAPVVDLAERLIEGGGRDEDVRRLAHLARALGATNSALRPYTRGQP